MGVEQATETKGAKQMFRTPSGQTGLDAYRFEAAAIANAQRELDARMARLTDAMLIEGAELIFPHVVGKRVVQANLRKIMDGGFFRRAHEAAGLGEWLRATSENPHRHQ